MCPTPIRLQVQLEGPPTMSARAALLAWMLLAICWAAPGALALRGGSVPQGARLAACGMLVQLPEVTVCALPCALTQLVVGLAVSAADSVEGQTELSQGEKWISLIGRRSCNARGEHLPAS